MTDTSGASPAPNPLYGLPALLLLAFLAFTPVFGNLFTTWDDGLWIRVNPALAPPNLHALGTLWLKPYADLYVPLVHTAWWFVASDPLRPALFHATSLAFHLAATAFLYRLLLSLESTTSPRAGGGPYSTRKGFPAFAGTLLFAVHPLVVESVAWASGLKDAMWTFFAIASLWALAHRRGTPWLLASLLLALLSKPTAVVIPGLWLALHLLILQRPFREIRTPVIAGLFLSVLFGTLAAHWQPAPSIRDPAHWPAKLLLPLDTLGFYLSKIACPLNLAVDYGRTPGFAVSDGHWIPHVALTLAVLIATLATRNRRLIGALLLFALPIAPVSGLKDFDFASESVVADHYAYPAMIGVAVAVTLLASRRPRLAPAFPVLSIVLACLTFRQATTWRNSVDLYRHAIAVNPRVPVVHSNLGVVLQSQGEMLPALDQFQQALAIWPEYPQANFNLAQSYLTLGDAPAALKHLKTAEPALQSNPTFLDLLANTYDALHDPANAQLARDKRAKFRPR